MSENIFFNEKETLEKHKNFLKDNSLSKEDIKEMYYSLFKSYEQLLNKTKKIEKISDINHKLLNETKMNLKLLLDNSEEGFFTFGNDFLINRDYSNECLKIFDKNDIFKINALILLFGEEHELEKKILNHIFENNEKEDVYLDLLPTEIKINNKFLKIRYKILHLEKEKKIMCIVSDITEKKNLEEKLEIEMNNNKMIINIIIYRDIVKKTIDDYINYCTKEIYYDINNLSLNIFLSDLLKKMHTYKGLFLQWNMIKAGKNIDNFENALNMVKKDILSKKDILNFIKQQKIESFIDYETTIIEKTLGENFLKENKILIDKNKLLDLEKLIEKTIHSQKILIELKKLYYHSFVDVIKMYKKYSYELAIKLGKKINKFTINYNKNIFFNPEIYFSFNKSLIHIFRNIIVHGIEFPDERLDLNKTAGGNIYCEIFDDKKYIYITISDDGKGININKLRKIKNNDSLLEIFCEGFTTCDSSNEFAGKGLGLTIIKEEVEKLNGKLEISSTYLKGTSFKIILPKRSEGIFHG
ncbi:ATP-binding protein [Marinitoga litoralis]|uniref:ATP-binding protein n=1 Tax=Marinitoga litoralis TaxID=570855 RepID=UPI00195FCD79|nr:ATP-binding protein [Marinitoga litoralis]MBM7558908.1 two-component system chemotaxis sensor kinase CheA [Marinitoga litoralis]